MLQVCRYVYELMQTVHGDASRRLLSLDVDYWFVAGLSRMFVALIQHNGPLGKTLKVYIMCLVYNYVLILYFISTLLYLFCCSEMIPKQNSAAVHKYTGDRTLTMCVIVLMPSYFLLQAGDVIYYTPNNWRNPQMPGFIYGRKRRTGERGFFPRYKLVEVFKRVKTS